MAAIQLPLIPIIKHELIEEIKNLSDQKRTSSKERRLYKKRNVSLRNESKYSYFFGVSDEDRAVLRDKLRILHLAHNFIKGTSYRKIEPRNHEGKEIDIYRRQQIFKVVEKYVPELFTEQQLLDWIRQGDGE